MCQHQPPCPSADSADRESARLVAHHPEQGWSLLCNGVVFFEEPLAKTGASDKSQLYGEVGLKYGNEKAHAVQTGLKV